MVLFCWNKKDLNPQPLKMTNVLPWFSVRCITNAHTKVLCSPLVSRSAHSGVFNLRKSEIAELQPSMRALCLLGLPQRFVWWSEDFGNEKNLRGHRNTWSKRTYKMSQIKGESHTVAGRKRSMFYHLCAGLLLMQLLRYQMKCISEKQVLDADGPFRRLMKWWECILQTDVSVLQEKKQPSTQTGWPRASEKTLLYECGLLCGPMCVWWRCSNWRWVWLTLSIRSVVEVWTAALPRYRDHRIQTTICQTSFFFPSAFRS